MIIQRVSYPYLKVLFRPIEVFRSLLYFEPQRGVGWLVFFWGINYCALNWLFLQQKVNGYFFFPGLMGLLWAIIYGLCMLYAFSYAMHFTAGLIKLNIPARKIRLVIAWSTLPVIIPSLAFVILYIAGATPLIKTILSIAGEHLLPIALGALIVLFSWSVVLQISGLKMLAGSWKHALLIQFSPSLFLSAIFYGAILLFRMAHDS